MGGWGDEGVGDGGGPTPSDNQWARPFMGKSSYLQEQYSQLFFFFFFFFSFFVWEFPYAAGMALKRHGVESAL